jgi:hypothetical protein
VSRGFFVSVLASICFRGSSPAGPELRLSARRYQQPSLTASMRTNWKPSGRGPTCSTARARLSQHRADEPVPRRVGLKAIECRI